MPSRVGAFDDERVDDEPVRALTRDEAAALRLRQPTLSPWWVVLAQVAFGALAALVAWAWTASSVAVASAAWGAAVVAVPGALMARGATSRVTAASPVASAVGMIGWGVAKMLAAVTMLVMAPRVVPGLNWPAMIATLVLCLQTYWLALLWRGRPGR